MTTRPAFDNEPGVGDSRRKETIGWTFYRMRPFSGEEYITDKMTTTKCMGGSPKKRQAQLVSSLDLLIANARKLNQYTAEEGWTPARPHDELKWLKVNWDLTLFRCSTVVNAMHISVEKWVALLHKMQPAHLLTEFTYIIVAFLWLP